MNDFETLLASYDYEVSDDMVALTPAEPRDSAKLLVYSRAEESVRYDTFANLAAYLPKDALLVFNDTKVIPARIYAQKKTGGMVEILCTSLDLPHNTCVALANKKLAVGDRLTIGDDALTLIANDGAYVFRAENSLAGILHASGRIPIPPYLKHTPLTEEELREKYQAVFAAHDGSIAAPTASLHFTHELLEKLKAKGIESTRITLHVNLGTFAPLTEEAVAQGKLHDEHFDISTQAAEQINAAHAAGRPIIAVGTTAARALESTADAAGAVHAGASTTNLFIREGYHFNIVNGLITNFHVPKSSLLMLVATLIGREKLFELYTLAKTRDFKFFSFGDGMLVC